MLSIFKIIYHDWNVQVGKHPGFAHNHWNPMNEPFIVVLYKDVFRNNGKFTRKPNVSDLFLIKLQVFLIKTPVQMFSISKIFQNNLFSGKQLVYLHSFLKMSLFRACVKETLILTFLVLWIILVYIFIPKKKYKACCLVFFCNLVLYLLYEGLNIALIYDGKNLAPIFKNSS